MIAYVECEKFGSARSRRSVLLPEAVSLIRTCAEAIVRRRPNPRLRSSGHDLGRLNDRLLNDVGLRRDHSPRGASRVQRF